MGSKYGMTSRGSGKRYLKDEDFDEGDVWSAMENMDIKSNSSNPKTMRKFKDSSTSSYYSSSPTSRGLPSTPRLIPRSTNQNLDHAMVKQAASASMMIPERRRSKKIDGVDGSSWVDYDGHGMNYGDDNDDDEDNHGDYDNDNGDHGEDEDDGGGEVVPPHEYIAKRLARSQISSFSVCEGTGRTLKGRDLSHVRNAILRKTGFLES
ncbi:S40-1-like protein [Drosera capensis]